jgi:predicted transcriptional regulator
MISITRSRSNRKIIVKVLEAAKAGATKAEIISNIPSLSSSQMRKITAELADKGYLQLDPNDDNNGNRYITTHRGHLFLNKFRQLEEQ